MRILLDETLCETTADSVGQAIASASALAEKRGRMIVEIVVDGKPWTHEDLDAAAAHPAHADEVRLTSADSTELVCQTFRDASRALSDANQLQQSAAELLQADQVAPAMEKLQEAITIWLSVQQALVMGLQIADIELNDEPLHLEPEETSGAAPAPSSGESFEVMVTQLNDHLRMMQEALRGKDTVALADTLLYDMPSIVQRWQTLFEILERRATADGAGQSEDV